MRFFWFLFIVFSGLFIFLSYAVYREINSGLVKQNSYIYHEIPIYISEETKKLNLLENKNFLKGLFVAFLISFLLFCFFEKVKKNEITQKIIKILNKKNSGV